MPHLLLAAVLVAHPADPIPLPPVTVPALQGVASPVHRIASAEASPLDAKHDAAARKAMRSALNWLRTHADERGGWLVDLRSGPTGTATATLSPVNAAVSALGLKAFVQAGARPDNDPMLKSILQHLLARQQTDGRFDDGSLSNYVTATIVASLAAVDDDDRVQTAVHDGAAALRTLQWDKSEHIEPTNDWYGGAGYGNRGRPDLSNTQWMMEALHAAGDCSASKDAIGCDCDNDPSLRRAVAFLTRCQNATTNAAPWAGDDGGFVYTPANNGESMASERAGEGRYGEIMPADARSLRSYGSMTYAGYKSLLFAGLPHDDPRVRAALTWIRAHWTLDENPGLGGQGYYYYLHGLARAMQAGGHAVLTDTEGTTHRWRQELVDALIARQHADGHWTNEETRWLEGHSELATIYAVLALQETLKPPPPTAS